MDGGSFDRVVKMFGSSASRRGAIVTLAAGLVGPLLPDPDAAAKRGKGHSSGNHRAGGKGKAGGHGIGRGGRQGKHRRPSQRQNAGQAAKLQAEAACYSGSTCAIGDKRYLVKCDLGRSSALKGKSCKSCNLSEASLRGADAAGANLSGANLSKVCLVDANLTGANLTGANTSGAIFCRTRMPNGSINNGGCSKATSCCPTCVPIGESRCALGGSCCGGAVCQNDTCVCPAHRPENCGGTCQECCAGEECPSGVCCSNTCCADGSLCFQNACCAPEPLATTCAGGKCGTVTNACGQRIACGECAERICHDTTCTAQNACAYAAHRNLATCEESGGETGVCCDGACVSGACCADADCPARTSSRCESHTCVCGTEAACSEPAETCCGTGADARCVDTDRDTDNCGGCGDRCRAEVCQVATCVDGECNQRHAPDGPADGCPAPGCCNGRCCDSNQVCFGNACCTPLRVCPQGRCGVIADGCGGTIDCGACEERTCQVGSCTSDGLCSYEDADDRTVCGADSICCGGDCVNGVCCAAEDCPAPVGNRCAGHECHCGENDACDGRTTVCCGDAATATCKNILTDPANCRGCGRVCSTEVCQVATCAEGRCGTQLIDDAQAAGCDGEGQHCCDGACVDLPDDPDHCGACDAVCPDHRPTCCGGSCTDLDRDRQHCGDCGNVCPVETCQFAICRDGTCSMAPVTDDTGPNCMGTGERCCDGACIDTTSDPQNCGGCGNACLARQCEIATCTEGVCGVIPLDGQQHGACELPAGGDGICCAGACLECCGDDISTCTGPIPVCHSRTCDGGVCATAPTTGESCGSGGACCDGNCQSCCGDDISTCPPAATCERVSCLGGNCATTIVVDGPCELEDGAAGVCCDGACQGCCGRDTSSCDDPAICQIVTCSTGICAYATAAEGQQGTGCTGASEFCCGGGACCTDGQVCAAGACCTPDDPAVTCAGKCGTVTNNCGRVVNCDGTCVATGCQTATCNGTTCTIGTAANGTDPNNFCPGDQVCVNGACGCSDAATHCGSGQVCCSNQCLTGDCCAGSDCAAQTCRTKSCTNNQCAYSIASDGTDPGNRCLGSLVCVSGACGCIIDTHCGTLGTCCNGTCCDFNQTCCGDVCCDFNETCCGNVCCGSGQSCCNGVCKNTLTDIFNCGSCGHRCAGLEVCEGGACQSDVNNCRIACSTLP